MISLEMGEFGEGRRYMSPQFGYYCTGCSSCTLRIG